MPMREPLGSLRANAELVPTKNANRSGFKAIMMICGYAPAVVVVMVVQYEEKNYGLWSHCGAKQVRSYESQ